mmetsp:Transcript_52168/g.93066  ORF Transcript_52168/g.93066 Transcript_52168/m.93066 type:complete len:90 (-) Transcript_52168:1302-1571(-)
MLLQPWNKRVLPHGMQDQTDALLAKTNFDQKVKQIAVMLVRVVMQVKGNHTQNGTPVFLNCSIVFVPLHGVQNDVVNLYDLSAPRNRLQ